MVMAKPKLLYEESRQQSLEENRKKMAALNLPQLAQLAHPAPVELARPRTFEKHLVQVRRSTRFSNHSSPVYKEVFVERVRMPRRSYRSSRQTGLWNRTNASASDEARAAALHEAQELVSGLGSDNPTIVKTIVPSYISGGFFLCLKRQFCMENLSKGDEVITLVDVDGNEYPTRYLAQRFGLSAGWKEFAFAHDLVGRGCIGFSIDPAYCI